MCAHHECKRVTERRSRLDRTALHGLIPGTSGPPNAQAGLTKRISCLQSKKGSKNARRCLRNSCQCWQGGSTCFSGTGTLGYGMVAPRNCNPKANKERDRFASRGA
eukprot:1161574-Pelagomonas_calceolata.AAC.3